MTRNIVFALIRLLAIYFGIQTIPMIASIHMQSFVTSIQPEQSYLLLAYKISAFLQVTLSLCLWFFAAYLSQFLILDEKQNSKTKLDDANSICIAIFAAMGFFIITLSFRNLSQWIPELFGLHSPFAGNNLVNLGLGLAYVFTGLFLILKPKMIWSFIKNLRAS